MKFREEREISLEHMVQARFQIRALNSRAPSRLSISLKIIHKHFIQQLTWQTLESLKLCSGEIIATARKLIYLQFDWCSGRSFCNILLYKIGYFLFKNSWWDENKETQGIGDCNKFLSKSWFEIHGILLKEIDYGGDEELNATSQALIGILICPPLYNMGYI